MLGGMERPDVDKITGLSPVISIEQKTTNKKPSFDRRDNNGDIRFLFAVPRGEGRGSILLFIGGKNGSLYRGKNHFSDNGPIPE